jgi:hypothetical protein
MQKCIFALIFTLAALTLSLVASGAFAQGPPPLASPFNPSMGDLMNTLVQPRHPKLGLIGKEQNWTLAAYRISSRTRCPVSPSCGRDSAINR